MGLVTGEVGRGSFVKAPGAQAKAFELPSAAASGILDLSQASPPRIHASQDLDTALRQIMASASRLDLLDYTPPEGHPLHRAMGVTWLARSGIKVTEDDVVVTAGAHAALIACLAAITERGDRMFVEGLNYCSPQAHRPASRHQPRAARDG